MNEPGTRELDRGAPPGTVVPCPLKAFAQIGVGRCVEYQRDNGCNCEHALVSLRRVEEVLEAQVSPTSEAAEDADVRGERLDEVRGLIARAEQIEKQRPAKPAEETTMPKGVRTDGAVCGKGCGKPLGTRAKPGDACGDCNRKAGKPDRAQARKPPKANGGGQTVPRAEAVSGDVVGMLEAQKAHHLEQAEKIDKALAVLK